MSVGSAHFLGTSTEGKNLVVMRIQVEEREREATARTRCFDLSRTANVAVFGDIFGCLFLTRFLNYWVHSGNVSNGCLLAVASV